MPFDPNGDFREFERQMRDEFKAEAREVEALVEDSELRERSIRDVAIEFMHRGDHVRMGSANSLFSGQIVYAGKDFVTLKTPDFLVDINLSNPCFIHVIERAVSSGIAKGEGPGSFEMRLLEQKTEVAEVELGATTVPEPIRGRLQVVGQDHVVLLDRNKETWVFPVSSISFFIRKPRIR